MHVSIVPKYLKSYKGNMQRILYARKRKAV